MRTYAKFGLESTIERAVPKPLFEFSPEKIEKLKTYADVLLALLSLATITTMVVVAPNALQALEIFEKKKSRPKLNRAQKIKKITRSFRYLREWGQIDFVRKGQDFEVKLTKEGKAKIKRLNLETLTVPSAAKWDEKFWQVAADIPTKAHRRGADALRTKLKQMNFYPLQRTLWFYPYDPRVEIEFVCRSYGIANFVTVMRVDELDLSDERALRRYFRRLKII